MQQHKNAAGVSDVFEQGAGVYATRLIGNLEKNKTILLIFLQFWKMAIF